MCLLFSPIVCVNTRTTSMCLSEGLSKTTDYLKRNPPKGVLVKSKPSLWGHIISLKVSFHFDAKPQKPQSRLKSLYLDKFPSLSVSLPSSFQQHLTTAFLAIYLLCLSASISPLLLVQIPSSLFHLSIFTFSSFLLHCLCDPLPSMLLLSMEVNFTHCQVTGEK